MSVNLLDTKTSASFRRGGISVPCGANGLRPYGRPVRLRFRLALATSLAAACLHYTHYHSYSATAVRTSSKNRAHHFSTSSILSLTTLLHEQPLRSKQHAFSSCRRSTSPRYASTLTNVGQDEQRQEDLQCLQPKQDENEPRGKLDHRSSSLVSKDAADLSDLDDINALMRHPALMKNIKAPRNPIVLCHGLYGFDVRGPFWGLEIHYWANVLDILRKKIGAEVIVRGVPGTGAIADRAMALHKFLISPEAGVRGKHLNFIGHSMGGLDARYLISVIKPAPEEYTPVSLTCVNTPNRGSPFMDWCNANVGTGNDRVEAEIRKAKEQMRPPSSAQTSDLSSSSEHSYAQQDDSRQKHLAASTQEDFEKHEIAKPPFSLKTPLFVRPSKTNARKEEAKEESPFKAGSHPILDKVQTAVSGVTEGIVQAATTPDHSPVAPAHTSSNSSTKALDVADTKRERKDGGKKGSSSSLLDFSTFRKALSSISGSFSAYMLSVLDQPAYAMLSTRYMAQVFNATVPNVSNVEYYSVASRKRSLPVYHPLWLPKLILDAAAEGRTAGSERDGSADALGGQLQGNDGLVSVESARWGKFMGVVEDCDHWDLRGGGAPRWRGKVNPQTGKPLESQQQQKSALAEEKGDANPDEKKSRSREDTGWIDINRLVRTIFSANGGSASKKKESDKGSKGKDEEKHSSWRDAITSVMPNEAEAKSKDEQGLIDEVASWISDRLPKGDKARRAKAEQAADAQDKERQAQTTAKEDETPKSSSSNETAALQAINDEPAKVDDSKTESPPSASGNVFTSTSEAELKAIRTAVRLRREAAWQEELGHDGVARELRRELAWHRAEWDRALAAGIVSTSYPSAATTNDGNFSDDRRSAQRSALNWDERGHARRTVNRSDADKKENALSDASATDLERFWVAICRHLWARGF